jgi:hypothetical protein
MCIHGEGACKGTNRNEKGAAKPDWADHILILAFYADAFTRQKVPGTFLMKTAKKVPGTF